VTTEAIVAVTMEGATIIIIENQIVFKVITITIDIKDIEK
jgi:hypothetical protein